MFGRSFSRIGQYRGVGAAGWSYFPPSSDTVTYYVSSSGSGLNNGLSTGAPFATARQVQTAVTTAAAANGRQFPYHILFKRGDTFTVTSSDTFTGLKCNGRSSSEPLVIGTYGTGARPIFNCEPDITQFFNFTGSGSFSSGHNWVIQGLDVRCPKRDFSSPSYSGAFQTGPTFVACLLSTRFMLIEDCSVSNFGGGVGANPSDGLRYPDGIISADKITTSLIIRRCVFRRISGNTAVAHAQGIFTGYVSCAITEENVLDYCGYDPDFAESYPDGFSHANYHTSKDYPGQRLFRGNIIVRPSSNGIQCRAGALVDNNTFLRNPIAGFTVNPGVNPSSLTNNVVLDGWDIQDDGTYATTWAPATSYVVGQAVFNGSILYRAASAHTSSATFAADFTPNVPNRWSQISTGRCWGLNIQGLGNDSTSDTEVPKGVIRKDNGVTPVTGNIVANKNAGATGNNYGIAVSTATAAAVNCYVDGNIVYNWETAGDGFSTNGDPSHTIGTNDWQSGLITYTDPTRSPATYNASLGGGATFDDFMTECYLQSSDNWREAYTGPVFNNYIRAGFDMAAV